MAARPQGSDPITMGNYADLPPHERPGYMQAATQQYQPTDRGPASPTSPSVAYAQANIQYAQTPQYGYTTARATQPGVARNPAASGSFQYAPPPDKITFTAKPVVATTAQQPQVRRS